MGRYLLGVSTKLASLTVFSIKHRTGLKKRGGKILKKKLFRREITRVTMEQSSFSWDTPLRSGPVFVRMWELIPYPSGVPLLRTP